MATTTSNQVNTPESADGVQIGNSATVSKVAFFAATPVVQPTSASQSVVVAVTDSSGGSSSYTTGLQALTASYNSAILGNAISTLAAQGNANKVLVNQLRSDLVTLGLIKGS